MRRRSSERNSTSCSLPSARARVCRRRIVRAHAADEIEGGVDGCRDARTFSDVRRTTRRCVKSGQANDDGLTRARVSLARTARRRAVSTPRVRLQSSFWPDASPRRVVNRRTDPLRNTSWRIVSSETPTAHAPPPRDTTHGTQRMAHKRAARAATRAATRAAPPRGFGARGRNANWFVCVTGIDESGLNKSPCSLETGSEGRVRARTRRRAREDERCGGCFVRLRWIRRP